MVGSRPRSRCGRRPCVTDGDRRDVTLFLRVDDAELPVHDLQRLVAKVIAAPERLIGAPPSE